MTGYITFREPHSLLVQKLDENARLPTKAYGAELGYDLYALEDVILEPGEVTKIRTGIAVQFPEGYGALLRDRSSVATQMKMFVVAGVIDESYRGEVLVAMYNPGKVTLEDRYSYEFPHSEVGQEIRLKGIGRFARGDKIAQMIPVKTVTFDVMETSILSKTDRGERGFGSSGV